MVRAGAVALALVLAVGVFAHFMLGHTDQAALPFDRARWLALEYDPSGYCTRYNMVGDLIRRHRLVGMTRKEVEALLGPPDTEAQNSDYPYPGWNLGRMPGFLSTDSTALCLEFGADRRVLKIWNPGR